MVALYCGMPFPRETEARNFRNTRAERCTLVQITTGDVCANDVYKAVGCTGTVHIHIFLRRIGKPHIGSGDTIPICAAVHGV